MAYIKSNSNYVLRKKHQDLANGGTVYERDITTIGGVDSFAAGQKPIYRSGNFIMTVNDEITSSRVVDNSSWLQNQDSEIWDWTGISGITTSGKVDDTMVITLKHDMHNLKDFAYYGSCVELIRGSLNHIISTFPGELYYDAQTIVHYKEIITPSDNSDETFYQEGSMILQKDMPFERKTYQYVEIDMILIENPFNINIHTQYVNPNEIKGQEFKYFANKGYENYEIIIGNEHYDIVDISYYLNDECTKVGDIIGTIELWQSNGSLMEIVCGQASDGVIYLSSNGKEFHIRPKQKVVDEWFNSLSAFESVLMSSDNGTPYTAQFEVETENEFTTQTSIQSFTLPIDKSGWNLAIGKPSYNSYLGSLLNVATYYDELYCDNLYRSMTHEAIKNFDWTYSSEYDTEDVEAFLNSGNKIKNTLRLFGREFDEIKFYIDNIKNVNQITYSDTNNLPDYFMTDAIDLEGWDVSNIYSSTINQGENVHFFLWETYYNEETEETNVFDDAVINDLYTAYMNYNDYTNGSKQDYDAMASAWFNLREKANSMNELTELEERFIFEFDNYINQVLKTFTFAEDLTHVYTPYMDNGESSYYFMCGGECGDGSSKNHINTDKLYIYDEETQTVSRRISEYTSNIEYTPQEINNYFMRMLKLNSRSILRHKGTIDGIEMMLGLFGLKSERFDKENFDYKIEEKVYTTSPITDKWDDNKGDYKYDFYNKTKSISYSNSDILNGINESYQGLPVIWGEIETSDEHPDRVLFPYFNNEAEIDGNPYYQMYGGWLHTTPYTINTKDTAIIQTSYKETLKNIYRVDNILELLTQPYNRLQNNMVFYVNDITQDVVVIDGCVYPIKSELDDFGNVSEYFVVTVRNHTIQVGKQKFKGSIEISNSYMRYNDNGTIKYRLQELNLDNIPNGTDVKIYLCPVGDMTYNIWVQCYQQTINQYTIFKNGASQTLRVIDGETVLAPIQNPTKYFKLMNIDYRSELSDNGWKQISMNDADYQQMLISKDYFKGNNPHCGNLKYDNGQEYLEYFKHLFKYALETNNIDERCYNTYESYVNALEEMSVFGFSDITSVHDGKINSEYIKTYETTTEDSNIETYINMIHPAQLNSIGEDAELINGCGEKEDLTQEIKIGEKHTVGNIIENDEIESYSTINSKEVKLTFYILPNENKTPNVLLENVKNFESMILPYLTQVLPSSAIISIEYAKKELA